MRLLLNVFTVLSCIVLFIIVQFSADAMVGFLDWFFTNLPASHDVWDYPVLYILSLPVSDFILQWLPLTALACSLLLFMKRKKMRAYLTIISPLILNAAIMILFYYAAQMHVPPGQELFSSGVLIGKVESYAMQQERLSQQSGEAQNAD